MNWDLTGFAQWLADEKYALSTQENSLRRAKQILQLFEAGELPKAKAQYLRHTAERMLQFAQAAGVSWGPATEYIEQVAAVRKQSAQQRKRAKREQERKRKEAHSYPTSAWRGLYNSVRAQNQPADAVIRVLMETGLRIGDVLDLTRQRLTAAQRTGILQITQKGGGTRMLPLEGASGAWLQLERAWTGNDAPTVAFLVSPLGDGSPLAGGAAYKKVLRRLKYWHRRLKLPGRAHLHRLRRTVAVQALNVTKDVKAVQELLGHRSYKTTLGYVDESRSDAVAELQTSMRRRFLFGEEE